MQVPEADGKLRLWRNTSVATLAPGQMATLGPNTLGYEWDEDLDNGARPAGLVRLSTATWDEPSRILDYGSNYGAGTGDAPPHAVPPRERRSGVRGRLRAVELGARRRPRPRRRPRRRAHAAGDREPPGRLRRAAHDPAGRARRGDRVDGRDSAHHDHHRAAERRERRRADHRVRHGERRRRPGRRGRGLGRRRRELAPRERARDLELHLHSRGARPDRDPRARRRRQREPRGAGRGRHRDGGSAGVPVLAVEQPRRSRPNPPRTTRSPSRSA